MLNFQGALMANSLGFALFAHDQPLEHCNTKQHLTVLPYVFPSFCPKFKGLPWWSAQSRCLAEITTWASQGAKCKQCQQCVPPVAAGTIESHGRECSGDRSGLTTSLYYKIVNSVCADLSRLRKWVGSLHGLFVGGSCSLSELPWLSTRTD